MALHNSRWGENGLRIVNLEERAWLFLGIAVVLFWTCMLIEGSAFYEYTSPKVQASSFKGQRLYCTDGLKRLFVLLREGRKL